jgi:hypothetical protein
VNLDELPNVGIGTAFRIESLEVHVCHAPLDDAAEVTVVMRVPDILDQKRSTRVVFTKTIRAGFFEAMGRDRRVLERFWTRSVYELLRDALLHELDEHFRVDGERVRDPHRDERGR